MTAPPDLNDRDGAVPELGSKGTAKPTRFSAYEREAIASLSVRPLTVWDGVDALGTPNLRTVVSTLQSKGIRVDREWFTFLNRHGKRIRARRYWIDPAEAARIGEGRR